MDYPSLRAMIAKNGITNRHLAKELGLSEQTFYNKMVGASEFKNSEIKTITKELNLSLDDVNKIFFDNDVN